MRTSTGYEYDSLAEQYGFISVYPNGYKNHWNDCRKSASYQANIQDIDDISFFSNMIQYLSNQYSTNTQATFITGISNGGHMAYKLALEAPELVKGIAPIAANLPVDTNLDCKKMNTPISIALFNGTADPINPYNGGLVEINGDVSRGEVLSTQQTINYWLMLNNNTELATEVSLPDQDDNKDTQVLHSSWPIKNNIKTELYTLTGSGHVIPSKITRGPRILGEPAGDISSAEVVTAFFYSLM